MNYQMLRDIMAARPKSFAFLAFLALLAAAAVFYVSARQQPELEKARSAWFAKRDSLARGELLGEATRYHNAARDLDLFRKRLTPKRNFASLLEKLYDTGRNNSLSMKGVSLKPSKLKGEDIVVYSISFSLSGRYAGVKSFLADVSRFPEMVTIDSVALDNQSQTAESVTLRVQATAYLTEGA